MVGIAIIGCGAIANVRHAPECRQDKNICLRGFYDVNSERAKKFAAEYDCKAYETYEEVLEDADVDGVVICVANRYHCDMTIQALEHGKHVMCEKPIAVTVQEAQKMIDAAQKANRKLMVAHNQRFEAVNQKLKEIVDSGECGRIISFKTIFGHPGPEQWSVDKGNGTWFLNKSQAGLGAMGDIGIHKADLIHWLIDDDIEYVTARTATLDKKGPDGSLIALEDNAFCILESKRGMMGVLEASWTYYGKNRNITYLYCENGIIEADESMEDQIVVTKRDGSQLRFHVEEKGSGMVSHFAYCIENDQEPAIDGKEGMKALNIILKCLESSDRGCRVKV